MNDADKLYDDLLKLGESNVVDFKRDLYDLDSAKEQEEFIKDVICMANTPRERSAFIACGFDHKPQTGAIPCGIVEQNDGVKFKDVLSKRNVQPIPTINYYTLQRDGKHFSIFEIPVQRDLGRPFLPARPFELAAMHVHDLWLRKESSNAKADPDDLMRVTKWFAGGSAEQAVGKSDGQWDQFLTATTKFDARRNYVLVTDRVDDATPDEIGGLGTVPWLSIFDFDPDSEQKGLLSAIKSQLEQRRNLQIVVKDQALPSFSRNGTAWFFARGLSGRATTLSVGNYKKWLQDYGRELGNWIKSLAGSISPTPVTVVVQWHDPKLRNQLDKVLEEFTQSFSDELSVVVVSTAIEEFPDQVEKYEAIPVRLSAKAISLGLSALFATPSGKDDRCAIPTQNDGIPISIASKDRLWLEEELELLHLDVGLSGDRKPHEFARGEVVTWRDLQLGYDCQREITEKLRKQIESDLRDRKTVRVNLYHGPGAGGTTVARRVVWDMHSRFPCAVLHRSSAPLTADRLSKIYSMTQQAVLLLLDGGELGDNTVNQLYDDVRSRQTPVVMLQVLRRSNQEGLAQRAFALKSELSKQEADRFRNNYSRLVPERASVLSIRAESARDVERTAFYFGLEAFGRDFAGLSKFVQVRIDTLSENGRRAFGFLALAYRYAQQPLPAQSFASLFQLPRKRIVDFRQTLPAESLDLLVEESDGEWRVAHALIADEILQQVLCPQPQEREKLWKQGLSSWALAFAEFLRGEAPVPGEQLVEVARRALIYRDNVDLLGTEQASQKRLAQLLEDIPSPEGRLIVLRRLTELFPDEAHFHAHLGRFCGLSGRFEEALQAVDRALKINDRDSVVHHMRGMTIRYRVNESIDKRAELSEVLRDTKEACESFATSRRINPENEHGYISEIQLLVKVLDYAAKLSKKPVPELLVQRNVDPFLRESMDRAEELLERVRAAREGERASMYAEQCRAELDALYGDYGRALQTWDGLLARSDVHKPPIRRQIVWALLRRHTGSWSDLKPKEVSRCVQLLEDNFAEQPSEPKSMRLWLRAVRYDAERPSLDGIVERVSNWKSNTNELDAAFYLYVLYTLSALEGSTLARREAEQALLDSQVLARFRRNRSISFEWLGKGEGIERLVHKSQLGEWAETFYERVEHLERLEGRVASIDGPQKGSIELHNGQKAFFVPVRGDFQRNRDENARVEFYLGFSYDGLRAWEVQRKQ